MNLIDRLKSIFSGLSPAGESVAETPIPIQESFASLIELNALIAEQRRMDTLKREQSRLGERLKADIDALDQRRIALLTDALIDDDGDKSAEAKSLAEQISDKRRQLDDIDQVVAGVAGKIDGLNERREELRRMYLRDLGYFLNGIFKELAAEYNQKAGDLAELVLQIGAVQQVMMKYKTGDSNGFSRRVYLPKIEPGNAMIRDALLDGDSVAFRDGAAHFQGAIQEQLSAAGFNFRFD